MHIYSSTAAALFQSQARINTSIRDQWEWTALLSLSLSLSLSLLLLSSPLLFLSSFFTARLSLQLAESFGWSKVCRRRRMSSSFHQTLLQSERPHRRWAQQSQGGRSGTAALPVRPAKIKHRLSTTRAVCIVNNQFVHEITVSPL